MANERNTYLNGGEHIYRLSFLHICTRVRALTAVLQPL